jgi:hypothetical protein
MTARINEFITDARKIVANGEEALRHLAAGKSEIIVRDRSTKTGPPDIRRGPKPS